MKSCNLYRQVLGWQYQAACNGGEASLATEKVRLAQLLHDKKLPYDCDIVSDKATVPSARFFETMWFVSEQSLLEAMPDQDSVLLFFSIFVCVCVNFLLGKPQVGEWFAARG